jgi:hypothetical protein
MAKKAASNKTSLARLFELLFKYSDPAAFWVTAKHLGHFREQRDLYAIPLPPECPKKWAQLSAEQLADAERLANQSLHELWELCDLIKAVRPDLAIHLYNVVYRRDNLTPTQKSDAVVQIHEEFERSQKTEPPEPYHLTISEAAAETGIDRGTISRAVSRGDIKSNGKTGRERRMEVNSWHDWLRRKREPQETDANVMQKVQKNVPR